MNTKRPVGFAMCSSWAVPQSSDEVPEIYRPLEKRWRDYAANLGYTGPVVWYWHPDRGEDKVVFWVPYLAPNSLDKSYKDMLAHRAKLCQEFGMSEQHCDRFGGVGLIGSLLATYQWVCCGGRTIEPSKYIYRGNGKSEDVELSGHCLSVVTSGSVGGLPAVMNLREGHGIGRWAGVASDLVGFFLIGVEPIAG